MKKAFVIFAIATLGVVGVITAQQSRTSDKEKACGECCENEKTISCYVKRGDKTYSCDRGYNTCDQEPPADY